MTKRTLRNAIYVALAALSASLDAPRLAHEPLSVASAELTGASSAITKAATTVVTTVASGGSADSVAASQSHLGFDTNIYPGDRAMDAWKASGEYEWVGYYLPAPCHRDDSWSGTRTRLTQQGWGLAVIYVGQQTWGKRYGLVTVTKKVRLRVKSKKGHHRYVTRTMQRTSSIPVATTAAGCSATYVNGSQGVIDARDAIAQASHEGFQRGTTVFLDVEYMDELPQRMRDYYRAWTRGLLADGRYRPGIYAHTHNAQTVYDDVSDEYIRAGVNADPPFWVAGGGDFSPGRLPSEVGRAFATAWQGMLDVVRSQNGVELPVDISVASVASPSAVK